MKASRSAHSRESDRERQRERERESDRERERERERERDLLPPAGGSEARHREKQIFVQRVFIESNYLNNS